VRLSPPSRTPPTSTSSSPPPWRSGKLTRTEKQALQAVLEEPDHRAREVISWLEDVLVSDDPRLVQPFCRAFDELWTSLE